MGNKNEGNLRPPCVKSWVGVLDGGVSRMYPVETENYFSETGERLVRISYNTDVIQPRVGMADFFLNHARNHPGTLTHATLWFEFISYLENEPTEIRNFWEKFDARDAERERMRAMSGTKFANFAKELEVITWASQFEEFVPPLEPIAPKGEGFWDPDKDEGIKIVRDAKAQMLQFFGRWVVHAVQHDREAPLRLHKLLKNPNFAENPTPDQLSQAGRIYASFESLVVENMRLPTKKRVRRNAGFGDDSSDFQTASEHFRKLGLGGLPEG